MKYIYAGVFVLVVVCIVLLTIGLKGSKKECQDTRETGKLAKQSVGRVVSDTLKISCRTMLFKEDKFIQTEKYVDYVCKDTEKNLPLFVDFFCAKYSYNSVEVIKDGSSHKVTASCKEHVLGTKLVVQRADQTMWPSVPESGPVSTSADSLLLNKRLAGLICMAGQDASLTQYKELLELAQNNVN